MPNMANTIQSYQGYLVCMEDIPPKCISLKEELGSLRLRQSRSQDGFTAEHVVTWVELERAGDHRMLLHVPGCEDRTNPAFTTCTCSCHQITEDGCLST